MIPNNLIQIAKNVSIAEFLKSEGFNCVHRGSNNSRFENPLRSESTPSFDVNEKKNLWYDRGTQTGGDIIKLVMLYRRCRFKDAVNELAKEPFVEEAQITSHQNQPAIELIDIKKLNNKALIQYLVNRKINIEIARIYLSEAYYAVKGRNYFSLAFPNELGGYELRNSKYKGCTGTKYLSRIVGLDKSEMNLFEGFMDFLSYLTYNNWDKPKYNTVVLNSLSFLKEPLISEMQNFIVHSYLDNDQSGVKATQKLNDFVACHNSHSSEYWPYNDYNDFLMNI